jgi:hypothetical protein
MRRKWRSDPMSTEIALTQIELERIAPLAEAARLRGVSVETLLRTDRNRIIQLGPRRLGMRVKDALMLSNAS